MVRSAGAGPRGHRGPARPLFAKYLKGTRAVGEITSVRFPTPDVALVHGLGAVVKGGKQRTRFNTKCVLYVVVRRDGAWEVAAFQNTKYHGLFNALLAKQRGRSGEQ
nr:SgcJ/EcaC family oxidoreductase [Nocardia seriolae]